MVKKELKRYFRKEDIEKKWIGKNGTQYHLFENGNFIESKMWMYRERKESVLNKCIQFYKALTIADLYFALNPKKQKKFSEKIKENENNDTMEKFNKIKNVIDEIGITKLEKSNKAVENLYKKLIKFFGDCVEL